MKTLMVFMLAVGALAADTTEKAPVNKQAKRGILSIDQRPNIDKKEQSEQQLIRYVQPGHQYVPSSGPDSTHAVQVSYQKAVALPSKNQHDTEATVVYDEELSQFSHHQTEQVHKHEFNHQGQQVGQEFHGYDGLVSTVSPLGVESHFLSTPVGIAHQVPVEVQHQVPLGVPHQVPVEVQHQVTLEIPHQVPVSVPHQDVVLEAVRVPGRVSVEVGRSLEIPVQSPESVYVTETHEVQQPIPILVRVPSPSSIEVAHQQPLSIVTEYATGHNNNFAIGIDQSLHRQHNLAGPQYNFYRNPVNFGALEFHSDAGNVAADQHIDVGSHQYNFRGFENSLPNVYQAVSYEQHVTPPVQLEKTVPDNQHSGYNYDKPTKKFTF